MRFTPKTEKEIQEENLLPIGTYDFEIYRTEDKVSSGGNDMIELGLRVYGTDGSTKFVTDYLLESMAFKLRHASEACGLLAKYESGTLEAQDFLNKTGQAKIKIQSDKTGKYSDKNVVADYIKSDSKAIIASTAKPYPNDDPLLNDEIPF